MNLKYTLYLCLGLLAQTAMAQQGQKIQAPQHLYATEKMSAAINSPYPEINPVISPDGKTLYFVRENHPENTFGTHQTQDIWFSELQEDGNWSEAARMPDHLNKNRYNAVFGVFDDGNSLLLNGRYNKAGTIWKKRGFSVSKRTETGWSKPYPLKIKKLARKNKGLYTTATISNDGKYLVYGFSKRYNSKRSKLYVSQMKKEGKYTKPKKIRNKNLNTSGSEDAPFLSADGKYLYLTSDLTRDHMIFYLERQDEKGRNWSFPKSVGDSVNTRAWESYFSTNPAGTHGFFSRNYRKTGADIYQVKLKEARPYILVTGKILSPDAKVPFDSLTPLTFYINNEPTDSVKYDAAAGSYELRLPFGSNYELKATAPSHREKTTIIEGAGLVDYTEMEKDLYILPVQVAKVEGKLLIRSSSTPIPSATSPKILVNGKEADSVIIDPVTNRYQLFLPYGKDYKIEVKANGFEAEKETLVLSHIKGYEELTKDLYVDKGKKAVINGIVYDKKTGKPFSSDVPLRVIINDKIEADVIFNEESSTFSLELPLGTQYTINAKAEGYYPMIETVDLSKEKENVKVLKDLYLAPIEVGQSIRLNNIFFETGKANLKTDSYPELERVLTFLKENPKMKIEIAGHTDNVGSAASNKKLSGDRAKAVETYLVSKGLEDDRITHKGYGSTKPEADNATEEGRSLNRRVEFTILEIVK